MQDKSDLTGAGSPVVIHTIPAMKRIKISYGGSHRKNKRDYDKLAPFLAGGCILPASLGSKRMQTTAYDSPELRAVLKQIGGSVCRFQPSWLNEKPH